MKTEKKRMSPAMLFIILFGIVSLFSDMTHEGASSIRGHTLRSSGQGRDDRLCFVTGGTHRLLHVLCLRQDYGQNKALLADDSARLRSRYCHGSCTRLRRKERVDGGMSSPCNTEDGKGHKEARQRYIDVLCGISGGCRKEFRTPGGAGSDRDIPRSRVSLSCDAFQD